MTGISDELRDKIESAISDPGHWLKRGDDYNEPITSWSARAVVSLLDEAGVAVVDLPEPDGTDASSGDTWWKHDSGEIITDILSTPERAGVMRRRAAALLAAAAHIERQQATVADGGAR